MYLGMTFINNNYIYDEIEAHDSASLSSPRPYFYCKNINDRYVLCMGVKHEFQFVTKNVY